MYNLTERMPMTETMLGGQCDQSVSIFQSLCSFAAPCEYRRHSVETKCQRQQLPSLSGPRQKFQGLAQPFVRTAHNCCTAACVELACGPHMFIAVHQMPSAGKQAETLFRMLVG